MLFKNVWSKNTSIKKSLAFYDIEPTNNGDQYCALLMYILRLLSEFCESVVRKKLNLRITFLNIANTLIFGSVKPFEVPIEVSIVHRPNPC